MIMIRTIFFVLSILCSGVCLGQITIQGKVVDAHNQPIPSASLQVVGQTQGVATDFDGNFSLQLESLPASIRVSSIGFVTQTISLSDSETLAIVLEEETMSLGEIVISASRTPRSEERRVGKECRTRWSLHHEHKYKRKY